MKIKLYAWSHCAECWQYYGSFDSINEIELFIKNKGYDPEYFKYDQ